MYETLLMTMEHIMKHKEYITRNLEGLGELEAQTYTNMQAQVAQQQEMRRQVLQYQ